MGLWLHLGLKKRREAMLIFPELVEGFRNENGVLEQMQMAYFHWGLLNLPKCKPHLTRKMWDKACTSLPPNYYSSAAAVSYAYISERWQWQCLEWQSNSKKGLLFFFLAVVWNKEVIQPIVKNMPMKNLYPKKLHVLFQKTIRISVDLDGLSPEWLQVKQQPTFSSFPHRQPQECSPQQWDFHFCCPCSSALCCLCTHYLFQEVGKLFSPVLAKISCNIFTVVILDAKTLCLSDPHHSWHAKDEVVFMTSS